SPHNSRGGGSSYPADPKRSAAPPPVPKTLLFLPFPSTTHHHPSHPGDAMEKSSGAAAGGSTPPPRFNMEDFQLEGKKPVKNPFVPIGALVTAGVLTAGLISFRYGNSRLGQKLMRARVVAQGATVALMIGSAYYYGDQIKLFKKGSSP
ncbi:unnamed protein product, partial [Urochloa humidicola]